MRMLNDRLEECVATLDRERMGIEIVFRQRDGDDEYLYWIVVRGEGDHAGSSTHALDVDHVAYDVRCRVPGWDTAKPELLLLPNQVRSAVLEFCHVSDK